MINATKEFYIDVDHCQCNKFKQYVSGDVIITHKIKEENRVISILSDGLGSGIKASVLATLTASMAMKYTSNYADVRETSEVIMDTLPVCSVRKISYSTFIILDINNSGHVRIIEHDSPEFLLLRGKKLVDIVKTPIQLQKWQDREVRFSEFDLRIGDRIVFFSDGVSQAGMGSRLYPLGWGEENVFQTVEGWIGCREDISSRQLATCIVSRAKGIDEYHAKDDISCGVVYVRHPRLLLVVTGPPYSEARDSELAAEVEAFKGRKVICGGTTANIIARELDVDVSMKLDDLDSDIPPSAEMEGIDLVTEGTITLSKVAEILESGQNPESLRQDTAAKLVSILLDSDVIQFIVGTRINEAHQDPNLPIDLDIRRNIIKRISALLEEQYLKETFKRFI